MATTSRSAERIPEYELEKNRNIVEVLRKQNENMKRTSNLKGLSDALESQCQPAPRKKKKRQKQTSVLETQAPDRQLRSTSRLTTEILTEPGAVLNAPEVVLNELEGQEREVRKVTAMKSIWGRQNKPKLKLEINEYGQPCGKSATRFANFVGTQIRTKGFPVEFDDWRKVDLSKKLALWKEAKLFWELDQPVFQWYLKTAQIKWKDFKSDLKREYYDESYEYDELIASCDARVHPDQWKLLVAFWLTPKAKARSIRGNKNRANYNQNHTSGSKSFARVDTEMTEVLKRRPHRHELFIETHTHRISGIPQKGSALRIKELQDEAGKHPELVDNGIKDGDLFAFVCGKEKNGYVRGIGLGPTPSELELPGTQQYKSTKLQMAMEACRVSDQKVEHLQEQMDDMKKKMVEMDDMKKQMAEMRKLLLSSQGQRDESIPTTGQQGIRTRETSNTKEGNDIQEGVAESNVIGRKVVNTEKHDRQQGGGRDVILYSITRPLNVAVAKGTIQTTNPKAVVGGEPLGSQFVEIVVHSVFKRETVLPRPYGDVITMAHAKGKSIAWPSGMIKDAQKATDVPRGAGT